MTISRQADNNSKMNLKFQIKNMFGVHVDSQMKVTILISNDDITLFF